MTLKSSMVSYRFLKELEVAPSKPELKTLAQASEWIVAALKIALVGLHQRADVLVGGSYAKGTLVTSTLYDIDVFIRCHGEMNELIQRLHSILRELCMQHHLSFEHVHGSREYFRIMYSIENFTAYSQLPVKFSNGQLPRKEDISHAIVHKNIVFEIVPVAAIKKGSEYKNITDLSYAHVGYVRKELRKHKNLMHEIGLAKLFCRAQRVYGAESYVQGFSGYALECLVISYGSFLGFLRALVRAKEQVILDPAKKYKHKREIMLSMNESKLKSPIVLVDPTWKERNVLAALSEETFRRFQKAAQVFLKKPSMKFFMKQEILEEDLLTRARKKKAELLTLHLETTKQPGDIAGTKLKKFADVLARYFAPHFRVVEREFVYVGGHLARAYYFVTPTRGVLIRGPPLSMKEHARRFKREHPHAIIKGGVMFATPLRIPSAREFLKMLLVRYEKMRCEMDVSMARVV